MGSFGGSTRSVSRVEVLKEIKSDSGKIEAVDFVSYFRARFEVLRDILIKRGDLENLNSIRRIGQDSGVFCIDQRTPTHSTLPS